MLFASLCLVSVAGATTHPHAPPTSPPAHWGPVSINLEDVPYPHPVSFVELTLFGEPVRMAFMDVVPAGSPRGQTVVLLHGGNYFAKAWEGTIEALRNAGFRVGAIDQIAYGRSSKPIVPYSLDMPAVGGRGEGGGWGLRNGPYVASATALMSPSIVLQREDCVTGATMGSRCRRDGHADLRNGHDSRSRSPHLRACDVRWSHVQLSASPRHPPHHWSRPVRRSGCFDGSSRLPRPG
jgi:hypothetical protein